MDSAESTQSTDPVLGALTRQGELLGRHEHQLGAVHQSMEAFTTTVSSLSAQLQEIQLVLSAGQLTAPPPTPPQRGREPKLPPPQSYDGEPGTCRSFLSQCSVIFELQPTTFPSDRSRVAYIITLLTGRAREWGTAVWDNGDSCCDSLEDFRAEMKRVFDRSHHGREAAREMLRIRQGARSVSDYAIQLRTLAATTAWNPDALYDVFLYGLSEEVKDELATRELPVGFQELVDLSIRIDSRIRQRRQERYPPGAWRRQGELRQPMQLESTPSTPSSQVLSASTPEPMQVDRASLSPAERRRRMLENACLYCGQGGHFASACPVKAKAHP